MIDKVLINCLKVANKLLLCRPSHKASTLSPVSAKGKNKFKVLYTLDLQLTSLTTTRTLQGRLTKFSLSKNTDSFLFEPLNKIDIE